MARPSRPTLGLYAKGAFKHTRVVGFDFCESRSGEHARRFLGDCRGSKRAGHRAAAVTSLIQSARLNGYDPYTSLRDGMTRLPMQRASQIGELLPHRWQPA